eukprot:1138778-Pelagomonas_calceolata.AAC.4
MHARCGWTRRSLGWVPQGWAVWPWVMKTTGAWTLHSRHGRAQGCVRGGIKKSVALGNEDKGSMETAFKAWTCTRSWYWVKRGHRREEMPASGCSILGMGERKGFDLGFAPFALVKWWQRKSMSISVSMDYDQCQRL